MTASICHTEAQLLKRNEKLEVLWAIDGELRSLHSNRRWRDCASSRSVIHDLAAKRQALAAEITEMGAAPWCFHIERDNSWLAGPRGG